MNYKIVASDLDGTLLNSKHIISQENLDAIKAMNDMGINFVVSTGRAYSEVMPELISSPYIRYYICSNGAIIYDKFTKSRTCFCMDRATSNRIFDILYDYDTQLTIRQDNAPHFEKGLDLEEIRKDYHIVPAHLEILQNIAIQHDDFKNFIYGLNNIEVLSAFFRNEEERIECRKRLEADGSVRVVEGCPYNLEIMSIFAGKGIALNALADMLQIPISQVIGVGDSDNDRTMIEAAGLGLAMENACTLLKDVADKIICHNDDHAIKYILENIIKKSAY